MCTLWVIALATLGLLLVGGAALLLYALGLGPDAPWY